MTLTTAAAIANVTAKMKTKIMTLIMMSFMRFVVLNAEIL